MISEVDKEATNTESIHLKNSVQTYDKNKDTYVPEDASCISVKKEEVYLWVDENFIIIWSCTKETNQFARTSPYSDGAVIMGWFPPKEGQVDIKEVMARLKVVAEKYLGPNILVNFNIDWIQGPQSSDNGPISMFVCVQFRG